MVSDYGKIRRILIINLAFIGDVLLSTPVARALREAYPEAIIDMLVVPLVAPIASGNPYIDHVWEYDKRGKHKTIREVWKLVCHLRSQSYDLAVTTNFAARGAILAWACRIPCRVGYDAQHASWFLTQTSSTSRPLKQHEAMNYLAVLAPLGITTENTELTLAISEENQKALLEKIHIDSSRPQVVLCPIGSYRQKSWTAEGFAELLKEFSPRAQCYLIGARKDEAELGLINQAAGHVGTVLAGTLSLGELAAFLAQATVLITVDTGPMHIASAVGIPIVALFGPTDPSIWGPRGPKAIVVNHAKDCSPCWGKVECSNTSCMSSISLKEVTDAVVRLIGPI